MKGKGLLLFCSFILRSSKTVVATRNASGVSPPDMLVVDRQACCILLPFVALFVNMSWRCTAYGRSHRVLCPPSSALALAGLVVLRGGVFGLRACAQ